MSNKIISRPYDKQGEETYERVFGKKCTILNCHKNCNAEDCDMFFFCKTRLSEREQK